MRRQIIKRNVKQKRVKLPGNNNNSTVGENWEGGGHLLRAVMAIMRLKNYRDRFIRFHLM